MNDMRAAFVRGLPLAAILACVACATTAPVAELETSWRDSALVRAISWDGDLWVLNDAGRIFRITEGERNPTEVRSVGSALDLCVLDGQPAALLCAEKGCSTWELRRWDGEQWTAARFLAPRNYEFRALICDTEKPSVLTARQIVVLDSARPSAVALSEEIPAGVRTVVYPTSRELYVGTDHGEFGGGLRRIDQRTGQVTVLEGRSSDALCDGPLESDCDPVHGIAGVPGRPGCLVAAIGMVHFWPYGRLVEVCADQIRELYSKPYAEDGQPPSLDKHGEPLGTVAFFGLVRDGEVLWALGIDGIYQVKEGQVRLVAPLPTFEKVGGFRVAFSLPRFVLVLTAVDQRVSVSGGVPMIVLR